MIEVNIMIKFGKKVNLRPVLLSVLVGFIPGCFFWVFFNGWLGFFVGFCFFAAIIAYYYLNLSKVFNYWQFDGENIEYNDMTNPTKKLMLILFPYFVKMDVIKGEDIKSIKLLGDMKNQKTLPPMVPFSNTYSIFYARISMMKNPIGVEITMKDGKQKYLDISRDYTYDKEKSTKRINDLLSDFTNLNKVQHQ